MTREILDYFKKNPGPQRLEQAISATRRHADTAGTLSARTRAAIVESSQNDGLSGSLPAVFTPTRQFLMASALPMVLAGALLVLIDRAVPQTVQPAGGTTVQVSKQGDQIYFNISNGKREHFVTRSTHPTRFQGPAARVTEGSYVDRISDGESLVFYRID